MGRHDRQRPPRIRHRKKNWVWDNWMKVPGYLHMDFSVKRDQIYQSGAMFTRMFLSVNTRKITKGINHPLNADDVLSVA